MYICLFHIFDRQQMYFIILYNLCYFFKHLTLVPKKFYSGETVFGCQKNMQLNANLMLLGLVCM